MTSPTGLRARVRAQLVEQIKDEARRQMATSSAAGLSLRAIARELGMVSSAIYRYFASRDELLTALLIDAFDDLGATVEAADAACPRIDLIGRWRQGSHAVRRWALAHPTEYALMYGSPVPGYRAPQDTVGPASRVTDALATVVADAAKTDRLVEPFTDTAAPGISKAARAEANRLAAEALPGVPPEVVMRALTSWTQLFGFITFELFGHLADVVDDPEAVFDQTVTEMAAFVGIPPARTRRRRSTTQHG